MRVIVQIACDGFQAAVRVEAKFPLVLKDSLDSGALAPEFSTPPEL